MIKRTGPLGMVTAAILIVPVWPYTLLTGQNYVGFIQGKVTEINYKKLFFPILSSTLSASFLMLLFNSAIAQNSPSSLNLSTNNRSSNVEEYVFSTSTLNLRAEPSVNSTVLVILNPHERLQVVARYNSMWVQVKSGNVIGYVHSDYIRN